MIVTISGIPGSGKSTIAKILVEKLRAERIYAGSIFREMAKARRITLEEFLDYTTDHPEVHQKIDQKIVEEARAIDKKKGIAIVEGRVQFYFIPDSFKIFLTVSLKESTQRIWKDLNDPEANRSRNEKTVNSMTEMKEKIKKRIKTDQERYKQLYGIDILEQSNYDLVIDTTSISAEQAAKIILSKLPL